MALQKQFHNIDMISGIDQRSDGKGLNSSFLELENGVFRKNNRYQKRKGFDSVDTLENGEDIDALGMLSRNTAPVLYGAVRDDTLKTVEPGIFVKDTATDEFIKKTTTRMTSIDKSSFFGYTNVDYVDFEEDETTGLGVGFVDYRLYSEGIASDQKRDVVIYDYAKNKVLKTFESEDIKADFTSAQWNGINSAKVLNGNNVFWVFIYGVSSDSYLYAYTIDKSDLTVSTRIDVDVTAGYRFNSFDCVYHSGKDKAIMVSAIEDAGAYEGYVYSINEALTIQKVELLSGSGASRLLVAMSVHTDGDYIGVGTIEVESGSDSVSNFGMYSISPNTLVDNNYTNMDFVGNTIYSPTLNEVVNRITSTISSDGSIESAYVQTYDTVAKEIRFRIYYRSIAKF